MVGVGGWEVGEEKFGRTLGVGVGTKGESEQIVRTTALVVDLLLGVRRRGCRGGDRAQRTGQRTVGWSVEWLDQGDRGVVVVKARWDWGKKKATCSVVCDA